MRSKDSKDYRGSKNSKFYKLEQSFLTSCFFPFLYSVMVRIVICVSVTEIKRDYNRRRYSV